MISSILVMEESKKQYPVNVTSWALQPIEEWHQTIEKFIMAMVFLV